MLTLWIVSDAKPGHLNQSLGLAEALARRVPATVVIIELEGGWAAPRVAAALAAATGLPRPCMIIGAGHATHLPLLALGWKFRAPTVVLMRPSLPGQLFDVCLAPRHDLGGRAPAANVIATTGALNRVVPAAGPRQPTGMFLIGGPAAEDLAEVRDALAAITTANPALRWSLTDSRRTAAEFLASLAPLRLPVSIHGHAATEPGWLARALASASEVWVTPDSVSMIHEALTSGARVGLLPCPATRLAPRLAAALDQLRADGMLSDFTSWQSTGALPAPARPLAEADRCAPLVLARLGLG
jgi:hypothetical protein